ncbi:hypothetical protein L7F22_021484 [Adiantum nelumboides]|nr:hypothetical protein [Adiantum nelumboides]
MNLDTVGSQAYLNRQDPAGHFRSSQCATLRLASKSYTGAARHLDNNDESLEEASALFAEELPCVDNYFSAFKSCEQWKHLAHAKRVHVHMCKNGLEDHRELGNHLVKVFLISGARPQALNLFNKLHNRTEFSWTALIQDLVDHADFQRALHEYDQMAEDAVAFSRYALVAALQACSGQKSLDKGREVHAQTTKLGLCTTDVYLRSSLVDLYSKCGSMVDAQGLIDKQPEQDAVSATAPMAGYVKQGVGDVALKCFDQMQKEGMTPGASTFVCSLKAIILLGAVEKGQHFHTEIIKEGWESNDYIGSSLVDLYAKCGLLSEAQAVFDELPERDVVSWTALIAGYAEHGFGEEALHCLERMDSDGVPQNKVTLMFGLKACSIIGDMNRALEMHSNIVMAGHECHLLIANTLVDAYAKWGLLANAWLVFNKLSAVRDVATWNALLSGYSEQGLGEEALKSSHDMRVQGFVPDVVTFVICLGACGSTESVHEGREYHIEIVKQGLENLLCVGSALLDMYMKCHYTEEAWEVFHALSARDSVSWTTLIEGFAEAELYEEALDCMEQMRQENVPFQSFTFTSGLKACKGEGLIEEDILMSKRINQLQQDENQARVARGYDKSSHARNARNKQPRASVIEAPKEDVHCKGSPLSYAWGKVREHDAFILFDPGSIHNFISHELAAKLGIQEFEMGDAMKADGAFIGQDASVTPLIGKLRLHIQGYVDKEDFFISPLKHEDVILGAPWFDCLVASIKFPQRRISFKFREKDIYIVTQESGSTIPLVNDQAFDKSIKRSIFAYMIFVKDSLSDVSKTQVDESGMQEDLELSTFLNQFQDVFTDDIPGELPPKRGDDDHAIV